jgi:SAM-dependent methyltransferase
MVEFAPAGMILPERVRALYPTHRITLIDVDLLFGLMGSDAWKFWYAKKEGTVEPEIPRLLELLEKCNASRVLDFGCGTGRHTIYFAKKGFEVYGFDASDTAIQRARELLGNENLEASLKIWDMTHPLPYQEDFFDAVLALRVVHHTYARNIELIAGEIDRVSKSGGYLFLQVSAHYRSEPFPDKREDHRFREVEPRTFVPLEGEEKGIPHHEFTRKELSKLFGNYRFIDIHHSTEHYPGWCLIARKR